MRCSLLLHSSLTLLPGQWDRRQSGKYTIGATLVIISEIFLIARHKSFERVTIARHNIKHVLWRAIAARVAFYSRPCLRCVHLFLQEEECSSFSWGESKVYTSGSILNWQIMLTEINESGAIAKIRIWVESDTDKH